MAPAWERARRALATRFCMRFAARRVVVEDAPRGMVDIEAPFPVAVAVAVAEAEAEAEAEQQQQQPEDEREASLAAASEQLASRSGSRRSAKICAICLSAMRSGRGQALFTAECSHKFHFNCISSNVQHGNKICPICRAVWKELPFQGPLAASAAHGHGSARINPSAYWPELSMLSVSPLEEDELPVFGEPEPAVFNDDEHVNLQPEAAAGDVDDGAPPLLEIMTYTEFPAIQESVAHEEFAILIHLRAPHVPAWVSTRAPLDLVTVLDVSGSMSGPKLALLKRAMRFVIENLDASDRLSVIAFSSSAWRLFPLRRMTAVGQQLSLQAVNSLDADGGTNIAEGLWKAARVVEDRQARNPVCSIILLSDGVDSHNLPPRDGSAPDYAPLVPRSILPGSEHHVPIHAFGFGMDHDSRAMHAVAQMSSGTFSFIDMVGSIQDAFAQCIGGLLSVVAQETRLRVECAHQGVLLTSIMSGSYASGVDGDGRGGFVDVGRLYADEERDFLATVRVPPSHGEIALVQPSCTYRDAVTAEMVRVGGDPVMLLRPANPVSAGMSLQVEREWHRVHATEDMAAAQAAAEERDYARAASILETRRLLLESCASLSWDQQTQALVAELREMQERVLNPQLYEGSGRAYLLSGLSSHSWQRATARGDSTELTGLVHTYQTPSMVDMLSRSQALQPEVAEALSRSPSISSSRSPVPTPAPAPASASGSPGLRRRLWSFRPAKSSIGRSS